MIDAAHRESSHWGHRVMVLAITALLAGTALLWAWNTLAVELFGRSEVGFKHVAALLAALTAVPAYAIALLRMLTRVPSRPDRTR
jgi:hypothetical protein